MPSDKQRNPLDNELIPGTLDMLILKTLSHGTMHGHAVASRIERTTNEKLRVEEGALYPALHRMEARGWVAAEWGLSENKRRAKFYKLTDSGEKQLATIAARWEEKVAVIERVIHEQEVRGKSELILPDSTS